MMFAQLVNWLLVFLCIDILYCHIEMLILTVGHRNHSVNDPVCLKLCENINPLNVHYVTFKIEVGTCGANYMQLSQL
jgi:hypothetical protein